MTAQEQAEYGDRKLAHYNAWLMDPKRPSGQTYPGFPEDVQAPVAKRMTKVTDKVAKKGSGKTPAMRVTKLDQAKALFSKSPGFSREQVIALFMERLDMSKAGATTYWYAAQK